MSVTKEALNYFTTWEMTPVYAGCRRPAWIDRQVRFRYCADNNPGNPYILVCDRPKIEALKQQFPELFHRCGIKGVSGKRDDTRNRLRALFIIGNHAAA